MGVYSLMQYYITLSRPQRRLSSVSVGKERTAYPRHGCVSWMGFLATHRGPWAFGTGGCGCLSWTPTSQIHPAAVLCVTSDLPPQKRKPFLWRFPGQLQMGDQHQAVFLLLVNVVCFKLFWIHELPLAGSRTSLRYVDSCSSTWYQSCFQMFFVLTWREAKNWSDPLNFTWKRILLFCTISPISQTWWLLNCWLMSSLLN